MNELIPYFTSSPHHLWLILGGVLLAIEVLGTSGYALWSGISAIIVGLIVWIVPINWQTQWLIFSVLTLIVVFLWWRWLQSRQSDKEEANLLSRPYMHLIGNQYTLIEPVVNGFGRIKVADSSWRVRCRTDLPAGRVVVIKEMEGNTFIVEPLE